jgi:excisionase family DNA binding protein
VPLGYRINELCESLGVSRPTVYAWMAAGQLEYYQLDGFRIVTAKSLEDFLERRLKSSSA